MTALHVCVGCGAVTSGPGQCPECRGRRDALPARRASRAYYHSVPWQRLRAKQLNRHPFCQWRMGGLLTCGKRATEVDHVTPRSRGGADSPDNLQSLCKSHHSAKTWREQHPGVGHPFISAPGSPGTIQRSAYRSESPMPSEHDRARRTALASEVEGARR